MYIIHDEDKTEKRVQGVQVHNKNANKKKADCTVVYPSMSCEEEVYQLCVL